MNVCRRQRMQTKSFKILHSHFGMEVAEGINPDVALEAFHLNITSLQGFDAFKSSLCAPGGTSSRVDLVLSCVDNYEARMTINQAWQILNLSTPRPK